MLKHVTDKIIFCVYLPRFFMIVIAFLPLLPYNKENLKKEVDDDAP